MRESTRDLDVPLTTSWVMDQASDVNRVFSSALEAQASRDLHGVAIRQTFAKHTAAAVVTV